MKPYEHAGQAHPPPLVLGPGRQGPEAEHGGVLAPPDLREQLLPRGFLHQLHLRRQPPAWQAAHTSQVPGSWWAHSGCWSGWSLWSLQGRHNHAGRSLPLTHIEGCCTKRVRGGVAL